MECLRYCFMDAVQNDLNSVWQQWKFHRIKPSAGARCPAGILDELFNLPQLLVVNCLVTLTSISHLPPEVTDQMEQPQACYSPDVQAMDYLCTYHNWLLVYRPTTVPTAEVYNSNSSFCEICATFKTTVLQHCSSCAVAHRFVIMHQHVRRKRSLVPRSRVALPLYLLEVITFAEHKVISTQSTVNICTFAVSDSPPAATRNRICCFHKCVFTSYFVTMRCVIQA